MPLISVKTKQGRVAFPSAKSRDRIPNYRYITVEHTPWIERLLHVHHDIEAEAAHEAKGKHAPVADERQPAAAKS